MQKHMLNFSHIHEYEVFMQGDSGPCHKAKKIETFFKKRQIDIFEWSENSSDLNPIENCWQKLKKSWRKRQHHSWSPLNQNLKNFDARIRQQNILEIE